MEFRPILSSLMRNKTGPVLVAVQVALSLAILANALHIVNIRQAVAARPSGVQAERDIFHLQVRELREQGHEQQLATQKAQTATLRAVPGVVSVAKTSQVPLSRSGSYNSVSADLKQDKESGIAAFYVSPDSLVKTWGLKLVEGRDFNDADVMEIDQNTSKEFPAVIQITRAMGEKVWPGATSFLGKTLYMGVGPDAKPVRVIGVIDTLQSPGAQVNVDGGTSVVTAVRLTGDSNATYTVRAEPGQRDRVMKEAEEALRRAGNNQVVVKAKTMDEDRQERYRADTGLSWMLITVSALLLLITASGIVGMASLWVTQRRKQIGVRRALGARRMDILRYFITENVMITTIGVVAGVLLALGLNQLLVSALEMARLPAGYMLAGAGVFWTLGVCAVYGPAWRAASTSPALATRSA
ncbi:ABC transporter permease [Pseudoduganella namucuonensis]|uniref:Putative ABC transport system permease protein n=1 Tax=Pseudoduganella namucuonensis TaxID=1035707 RepID=A0A1I7LDI8_9BURK|nr:FtsX-like permease family protein [Pseudoduganella namucuonensis]SFV07644.1 putative ABC transport system permease protein [Pseudoduganella namucuonensis]